MRTIALAGSPNVGKSTLFNALTGGKQHTGNWSGKTVSLAEGFWRGTKWKLVDLPGSYSLVSRSPEEALAENFLKSGTAECTVIVCDATNLERSLICALQILELTAGAIVCVNLIDEAQRAGTEIDLPLLSKRLGVPVVPTSAKRGEGLARLREAVQDVLDGFIPPKPAQLGIGLRGSTQTQSDEIARAYVARAQSIAQEVVTKTGTDLRTERLDRCLLHPVWGRLSMPILLFAVFWMTLYGANYPSELLQRGFDALGVLLHQSIGVLLPKQLASALLDGVYATVARVVAVMLPPMAVFYPLFSLLEELGYLPRIAFLLDEPFRCAGACGKQALTMCMGFGCNAAAVAGCRIIASRRERLIAVLTNALVPCNGRFPGLIFLITLSFGGENPLLGAAVLTLCVLLGVGATLLCSRVLSRTLLRGEPSGFVLELPPYRRPQLRRLLLNALCERTLLVLGRAVAVAAPAGLLLWLLANLRVDGASLLQTLAGILNAPAALFGLTGAALLAFLLASPANELVFPVLLMILTASGAYGAHSGAGMSQILLANGWSFANSVCMLLFFLFHWPCTTTLWSIYRETRSAKWTAIAALLPTLLGCVLCAIASRIF